MGINLPMSTFSSINVGLSKAIDTVNNISALRRFPVDRLRDGDAVITLGGSVLGDGLGGTYVWVEKSTAADDGKRTIKPDVKIGIGRWVLAIGGEKGEKGDPGEGIEDVMAPNGSALVGFKNSNADPLGGNVSTGFITRTVESKLKDFISILDYGVSEQNADNSVQLQAAVDDARRLAVSYAVPPRIVVPAGIYKYSVSPNWAMTGLHIDCQPGATFVHTGSGVAFIVDGGPDDGGFACMKVTGGLVIRGNVNTTDGAYIRAVHHSVFELEVQNVSEKAFHLIWTVCNEYTLRCSVLFRPPFNPVPKEGIYLSSRRLNQQVSACTFYNPIIEGLGASYGINLNDAIMNTFIGGTSESNAGGVYISDRCSYNRFIKTDFEFNVGGYDIFCGGQYNQFEGILADHESLITGPNNYIGGKDSIFDKLIISGNHNVVEDISVNSRGQATDPNDALRDNGLFNTFKRIRNALNQTYYVDREPQPMQLRRLSDGGTNGYVEASSDILVGGPAIDTYHYKYGAGRNDFGGQAGTRFTHSNAGTSFNGVDPIARRAIPADATDAASNLALTNAIAKLLRDWGAAI